MNERNPPSVAELNEIQAAWMALQSDAPEREKDAVLRMMERYPRTYVSGHDGIGICMHGGCPMSRNVSFEQAMQTCKAFGGRTDVAWNGKLGQWYALPAAPEFLPTGNPWSRAIDTQVATEPHSFTCGGAR